MALLFVVISVQSVKILECTVYMPPRYNDDRFLSILTCIKNAVCKYSTYQIIITSDFNLNSCRSNANYQYACFKKKSDLEQLNNCYKAHGGILALVLAGPSRDMVSIAGDVEPLVPIDCTTLLLR